MDHHYHMSNAYRPYGVPTRPRMEPAIEAGTWSVAALLRICLEPAAFFADVRTRATTVPAAQFAMVHASLVAAVAFVAASLGALGPGTGTWGATQVLQTVAGAAVAAAVAAVIGLVGSHVVSLTVQPVMRLSGGTGGYAATYGAVVYGAAPAALTLACAYCIRTLMPSAADVAVWMVVAGVLWSCATAGLGLIVLHDLQGVGAAVGACTPLTLVVALLLGYQHVSMVQPHATYATLAGARSLLANALPRTSPPQRLRALPAPTSTSRNHDRAQHRSRLSR